MHDPKEVRRALLEAAQQAGPRYLRVRGSDLEIAITGDEAESKPQQPPENKPQPAGKTK